MQSAVDFMFSRLLTQITVLCGLCQTKKAFVEGFDLFAGSTRCLPIGFGQLGRYSQNAVTLKLRIFK